MNWYRAEIAKCTYRQFTTGFYFGKTDENTQIYDNNTYMNEYIYLGIVGSLEPVPNAGCQEEESRPDGSGAPCVCARIEQRNKFSVGDEIEIMKPDGTNVPVKVLAMYNEEGMAVASCPHSKQVIDVRLSETPDAYDILRCKAEDTKVKP